VTSRTHAGTPAVPPRRAPTAGAVTALDRVRIERALATRTRYRYVQPRVLLNADADPSGPGWTIVSPNCSRTIDPEGGEIPIAWFEPSPQDATLGAPLWRLHRPNHAQDRWVLQGDDLTLDQALALVCSDPLGVWWP
jgi:hypothetical protein